MIRIVGVNLPSEKKIKIALTYICGIGRATALKILKEMKIDPEIKTKDLTEEELEKMREYIEKNLKVEGALKAEVAANIRRLKEIGCWRGLRHIKNLPVRGQKTRANARTKRGRKVTMPTARKVAAEKT